MATPRKSCTEILFGDDEGEGEVEELGGTQGTATHRRNRTLGTLERAAMASLASRGTQTTAPMQNGPSEESSTAQGHDRGTTEMQSKISLTGLNEINEFLQGDLFMYDDSVLDDDSVIAGINTLEPIEEIPAME